ncbi:ATP-binding protein [uncultured Desulfobacter sp.]|uniref:ATP-binding protein n=1 Tax=uncultured Desulfobacter sp. TaxID=240139 RepID=UPI002AA71784|nr:ATP-binding protein [uncultured Desulfobacter sp.]
MKKLPVGISTLKEIIEEGHAYVDKSKFVHDLSERGKYYFLSRPRRFGKSLFIDTLKAAFEADKDLFRGLWLYDNWDWEKRYPVIHISFAEGVLKSREELDKKIFELIEGNQKRLGVQCRYKDSVSGCFSDLIQRSSEKYGLRAVILIDEYDKPILDNIVNPKIAEEMREGLKNLYSVIKGQDANLRFVFLTGVSKFSKVSLFSGLNNLTDITLDAEYSAICGYTESEMVSVFSERLKNKSLEDIRKWYNGYAWLGEKVYNPFSILHYLRTGEFRNYWFETGTPEFLIKLVLEKRYFIPALQHMFATERLLGSFDIDSIEIETIMFQTGYLTIQEKRQYGNMAAYLLNFPNLEVKMSFTDSISARLLSGRPEYERYKIDLYQSLANAKIKDIEKIFSALFSAIPHDWYRKNKLSAYEGYYASIFYCYFTALGLDVTAEDTTSHGRIDMTVKIDNRAYIFEFKVVDIDKTPGTALEQIKQKGYAEKYRTGMAEIYLIGVEFDRNERNIVTFEWELLQACQ